VSVWTRLHRAVNRVAAMFCRHPEFVVCEHRHYDYDRRLEGYHHGFVSGRDNMEAKWRGNVYGVGPYAGYPPPGRTALDPPTTEPKENRMSEYPHRGGWRHASWCSFERGEETECTCGLDDARLTNAVTADAHPTTDCGRRWTHWNGTARTRSTAAALRFPRAQ
jgi:hypothetical protein